MYITVEIKNSVRELLEIPDYFSGNLKQVLEAHGFLMPGSCKGKKLCTACHIMVLAGIQKLHTPGQTEFESLHNIPDRRNESRLACQIIVQPGINGLIVKLLMNN